MTPRQTRRPPSEPPNSTNADETHPDPGAARVLYPDEAGGFSAPAPSTTARPTGDPAPSHVVADDLEAAHHWDSRMWKP